jgi:uncharacterized RDD family membrane protein YckC
MCSRGAIEINAYGGWRLPKGRVTPHGKRLAAGYLKGMNILLLLVVLMLLFGGGGFYFGGPMIGGGGLGLILLVCLIVYLAGGFRTTKS